MNDDDLIAMDAYVSAIESDEAPVIWERVKLDYREAMKLVQKLAALVWEDSLDQGVPQER